MSEVFLYRVSGIECVEGPGAVTLRNLFYETLLDCVTKPPRVPLAHTC